MLLAACCLLAAGCGGDDEPTPTGGTTTGSGGTTTGSGGTSGGEGRAPPLGDGRGGVELTELGSFQAPTYVAEPPGGGDLYVVEQAGRVVRLDPGGETHEFVDVSDEVTAGGEQGLLSIAFAPDFERSGRFYLDYTDNDGDTRIVEMRSPDGRRVEPGSERELLRIPQPFPNHNGGLLLFGPDRLLYIGSGDGGGGGDPDRNGLDLSTLLGKLLRIDPRRDGSDPYTIPPDNPFRGEGDARAEIYSYGLRNPWRFSFDRETGALSIGDVGQSSEEEVDLVAAGDGRGASFGWSAFEGTERFNSDQQAEDAVEPVLTYPLGGENCAVTGGYVVRDERLKSLYGRYLYGDFCAGELRSFPARPGQPAEQDRALGLEVSSLSSFGEDDRGRIYATSLDGPVYRLDPAR